MRETGFIAQQQEWGDTMSLTGTFRVDVEELGSISRKLDESVEGMRFVSRRMDRATAAALGHDSLDSACATFQARWAYGIGQITELANAVRGSVEATADSYHACETGIQQAFAAGSRALATPPSATAAAETSVFG